MKTSFGHLTYCTNIHSGESWNEHFAELKKYIPTIKKNLSANEAFGIGLRLSNTASLDLIKDENLETFKTWLIHENCYVFTLNGFPYGNFHSSEVKDKVHLPDWLTNERVYYTNRLINILAELLPDNLEGGISTSPLSYRHWHGTTQEKKIAFEKSTLNILKVVEQCSEIKALTGKIIHIDIEPEPDGLLETTDELIHWYNHYLLPKAYDYFQIKFGYHAGKIETLIKRHIKVCYDVCHVAVGFENHEEAIQKLAKENIGIGKIQLTAAIKADMGADKSKLEAEFQLFSESTYLHQVVALQSDNSLKRYTDLPFALAEIRHVNNKEWRAHFHVPLFVENYGTLKSTQEDIAQVLAIQKKHNISQHLEIETYTWEVLPEGLKLPIDKSIIREFTWVKQKLEENI